MATSPAPDECCPGGAVLLDDRTALDLAVAFRALGDPTRVRVLAYLAASESGTVCACHLPAALGISQPTLSFHMRKLHEAGLVDRDKRGRWVHWTVRPERLETLRRFLDLETSVCC